MFRENSENIWRVPKWREEQAPASRIWGAQRPSLAPRCPDLDFKTGLTPGGGNPLRKVTSSHAFSLSC